MQEIKLTSTGASYLLALWRLEEDKQKLSTGKLAKIFDVKAPSVIDTLKKLEAYGLIRRAPWKRIGLTKKGDYLALNIIHNHRILEVYFKKVLGLDDGTSCREASKMDYLVGMRLINKICKALNYPETCIHGKALVHKECVKVGT
ncbi:MAG: metal-dependent transcriptional regulator [archaeon]|nr:metal-dependent transcriptional regulator [archaeon]MCP8317565.1 metal-dependent transcriptional regulator [archaeon]